MEEDLDSMEILIDIAPNGDVVLVCGGSVGHEANGETNATKFQVQSQVLSLASPFFKSMLEPKFQEGTHLSKSGFVELPLPDDDPVAVRTLCEILHEQYNLLGERVDIHHVLSVAIIADKYDCGLALSGPTTYWFSKLRDSVTDQDRARLLLAMALLRQEESVQQVSFDFVMKNSSDIRVVISDCPHCPEWLQTLVDDLETHRVESISSIISRLENILLTECTRQIPQGACNPECKYVLARAVDFQRRWARNDVLWPISGIAHKPLVEICNASKTFLADWASTMEYCDGGTSKVSVCKGQYLQRPVTVQREIANAAENVEKRIRWLCVQTGEEEALEDPGLLSVSKLEKQSDDPWRLAEGNWEWYRNRPARRFFYSYLI